MQPKFYPPPPFDGFIEFLWYAQGKPQPYRRQSVLPSGAANLVVNLDEDRLCSYEGDGYAEVRWLPGIMLSGPSTRAFAIDAYQPSMLGVRFRPGGAHALFGPVIREISDARIALHDLWGTRAHELHARLAETRTTQDRFRLLFAALVAAAPSRLQRHPAVAVALARFERTQDARVGEVAAQTRLSPRRFVEVFSKEVGLAPKRFLRVARFQRVLPLIHRAPSVDWSDVAYGCGFSDQAHFIREFRHFSGLTPTQYVRHSVAGRNHAAVSDPPGGTL